MKQLLEFFPIILFFAAYKLYDIYIATAVIIAATIIQVVFAWFKHSKIETMQWITLGLVVVFGGATIYLHDEQYLKWKFSIIEWLFGIAFLSSHFIGKKTFIERMMSSNLTLPSLIWKRLNLSWASFFISIGFLNVYVMYNYNTDDWVSLGEVIDFLDFYLGRHHWPAFNVADSLVCLGAGVLIWVVLTEGKDEDVSNSV